jgi:aminoacrylate hydrolase
MLDINIIERAQKTKMPVVSIGDGDIYYESHGSGTPLLLVPGLGGTGNYWQPQIAEFSHHFQVIVHDHRGTGQSTRSEGIYSVDQMTRDLLGLMDAIGIERAHLIGHSTGGAIGQTLAIEHPERLMSLVLYASWTKSDPFMRRVFDIRKTLLATAGAAAYIKATPLFLFPDWWINENSATLEALDAKLLDGFPTVATAISRCDAVVNFDREAQLSRIKTPTFVVCAKDDYLVPRYFSERLAKSISGAELHLLERGGHACSQTVPKEFNALILSLLLRQRQRARESVSVGARKSV